jgi:hypothetical protein
MTTPELMQDLGALQGGDDLGYEQADLSDDDGLNERDGGPDDGKFDEDSEEKHKDFTLAAKV